MISPGLPAYQGSWGLKIFGSLFAVPHSSQASNNAQGRVPNTQSNGLALDKHGRWSCGPEYQPPPRRPPLSLSWLWHWQWTRRTLTFLCAFILFILLSFWPTRNPLTHSPQLPVHSLPAPSPLGILPVGISFPLRLKVRGNPDGMKIAGQCRNVACVEWGRGWSQRSD